MKKTILLITKIVSVILIVVILSFLTYLLVMSVSYYTLPEYGSLTITNNQTQSVKINKTYSILSYNLGFGAFTPEFSYYFDGGKYATAKNLDTVVENTTAAINLIKEENPDFLLLQEIDQKSTRSRQSNQVASFDNAFKNYSYTYASSLHTGFVLSPLKNPYGSNESGLMNMSKPAIDDSIRISLPSTTSWPGKLSAHDYCLNVTKYKTDTEKDLIIINVMLSAYESEKLIIQQLEILKAYAAAEFAKGNYVIAGGTFNNDMLPANKNTFVYEGISPSGYTMFEEDMRPLHFKFAFVYDVPTWRDTSKPYIKDKSFVSVRDIFMVSDNVVIAPQTKTIDTGFKYSAHQPTILSFILT